MAERPTLSARQEQVLELMLQGLPSRLIADRLGVSVNTVKEHRGLILRRMEVSSTVALIHKMQQSGGKVRPRDLESALAKPPEVLVVEDDDLYRELVVSSLKLANFACRGVSQSAEMETALSEQEADIVVLDLNLGEEDGLVIARYLRETRPFLGVVIMTVRNMVEERIEGLAMGADVYLVKPVDIRELVSVIRNLSRRVMECRASLPGWSG
jgi:DNA-binding NarL/FixJ family response regulator